MSVFLKILQCIFCCEEEQHDDRYDQNSYRSPLLESHSNDTSVRRSSATTNNDLLRQSDQTIIYYSENYPNLSVSDLTRKESSALSLPPQSSSNPLLSSTTYPSSSKPSLSSPKPTTSCPSFSKPPSSSASPSLSSTKAPPSFPKPPPSSPKPSTSSSQPSPSSPKPPTHSFKPSPSSLKATASSFESSQSPFGICPSPVKPRPSSKPTLSPLHSKAPPSFPKPPPSSPKPSTSSSQPSPSSPKPPTHSFKPSPSSLKAPPSSFESSQSPFGICPSPIKPRPSSKPTLSPLHSKLTNTQTETEYVWVQKDTSPVYKIPKDIEDLIKEDIVPEVLKKLLSPSTYKDYFAALLYAEDFYIEKWNGFLLKNVTLVLQEAKIYKRRHKNIYYEEDDEKDYKVFVAFEIDSIPEERPFLLSRDFVFARPLGSEVEPFKGIIYRVVKSNTVLAEFGEDFHSQHKSTHKYNVSFSFNRVCLKRAHQAIASSSASDSLVQDLIFPNFVSRKCFPASPPLHCNHKLDLKQNSAVSQILNLEALPPYLVEGNGNWLVVQEAVLQIYRSSNPACRILICAPTNRICDALMRNLKQEIPESDMFRANAAFREIDGVPTDILPSCLYKRECFVCPPLQELQKFRVIFSTFISSFRLHNEGITAGHFSHIFLMDASSATEPETMVPLANLVNDETIVVVTGVLGDRSSWVRSDIARRCGLRISYFERLRWSEQYRDLDPEFIMQVGDLSKRIRR